ncbi:MAG: Rpn family recombination-promoting nuclease/putative transposase [Spirochaetes bacterium]|nr:Rpn family recombination-promoting nuclease/putative transposase [Spirochaetota bacterium]
MKSNRKTNKKANRKYKDSVFRHLFNNEPAVLELLNAIEGTNYTDVSMITMNTVRDVLFSAVQNDVSFNFNKKIVILIEHQSTINENMPVRFLAYILGIYLNILGNRIYQEPLVKLPRPEFIVLYNGKVPFPKEKFIRLSDAFEEFDEEIENSQLILLDLIVRVYNINKGVNPELERKSKTLKSYAAFIAKVREYEKKKPLEEAIKSAVEYCIKKDILADYFKKNAQEVVKMITLEYSLKDAIADAREEGMEKGRIEGIEEGIEKGMEKGKREGLSYALKLMEQGLSYEEIKKKVEKESKKKRRQSRT